MKKKILFPTVYLLVLGISILIPLEGILFVLLAPSSLLILAVELASDFPQGTLTSGIYLEIPVGAFQFFLIGAAWDFIADYFKNKRYND